MSKSLLIFISLFIFSLASSHILSKFEGEFKAMMHHRNIGDTSKSFSIAMKILVTVDALKDDHDIESPHFESLNLKSSTCN